MNNRTAATALCACASLLLAAGCGDKAAGTDGGPADMTMGATLLGYVGGAMPTFRGLHFGPDATCGQKGVAISFSEGTDSCSTTSFDMSGPAPSTLVIYLSNFLPGTYTLASSTSCPGSEANGFFATFDGPAGGFNSVRGTTVTEHNTVTVDYYDRVVLAGTYDISFTPRGDPGASNGSFKGTFAGQHGPQ